MQRIPPLRKLPLAIASLFVASSACSAPLQSDDPVPTISVTAAHLKSARVELSPKVGTTVYTVDKQMIDMLGQGDDTPFNEVLL